jgi:hypothetical protein
LALSASISTDLDDCRYFHWHISDADRATPGLEAHMDLEVRDDSFDIIVVVIVPRSEDNHRIITWWLTPSSSTPTMGTIKSNDNTEDVDDDKLDGNTKMRRNLMLEHIRAKSPKRS